MGTRKSRLLAQMKELLSTRTDAEVKDSLQSLTAFYVDRDRREAERRADRVLASALGM